MALVVETGSGSATADSYETLANASTYAAARGLTFVITGADEALAEQAMRRATVWLDATYRSRFTGYRRFRRDQALEWPRTGAYDNGPYTSIIAEDEIPIELKHALIEAAVREKATPGTLTPDITPNSIKKSVSVAGAVSVEYAIAGDAVQGQRITMTIVDGILAPLIGSRPSSIFGTAARA